MDLSPYKAMKRASSNQGQILTEKPDDLTNPLQQTPLQPPEEILAPAVVNMHVEERQGRKMSWVMDDLNRDIAKLRVIFVERLTEPDKSADTWKSKAMPDKSYEILKILSSISDWLADANIDGESYTLPITEEEMKSAHDKPIGRRQFIEEQAAKLQTLLEESLDKTRRLTKFISTRQGMMEKFVEYLGGKITSRPPPPEPKAAPSAILLNLQRAGLGSNPEVEKAINDLDEMIQSQSKTIEELKAQVNLNKPDVAAGYAAQLNEVIKIATTFTTDMEQLLKDQQMESSVEELLQTELREFLKKITDLPKAVSATGSAAARKGELEKGENVKKHVAENAEGKSKGKKGKETKRD